MNDRPPDSGVAEDAGLADQSGPSIVTLLTTEHFTLQGARAATTSEGIGRSTLFIGAVSSTLVALGFIAQASRIGDTFYAFAFVTLPTLCLLGFFTFVRAVDISIEDLLYARAINRIRGRYLELAGEDARYFLLSGNDDIRGVLANMGNAEPSRWQLLFTLASMLIALNCVIAGTTTALAVARITGSGLFPALLSGVLVAGAFAYGHLRWQRWRHDHARTTNAVLFPSVYE
jgi:hypothetical protein